MKDNMKVPLAFLPKVRLNKILVPAIFLDFLTLLLYYFMANLSNNILNFNDLFLMPARYRRTKYSSIIVGELNNNF